MTSLYPTSVVIGKFFPPHAGHHYVIETALEKSERVWVFVCHSQSQSIPGWLRALWLRRAHPQAIVCEIEDTLGDDTQAWAQFTVDYLGFVPSAVFCSEDYGQLFASAMGSVCVLVDRDRRRFDVSATRVRERPADYAHFLKPYVQAWFVPRICLVGAESTGKTTLAQALAYHLDTVFVSEYGREYCERKISSNSLNWDRQEFREIANEHVKREDLATEKAKGVLIVDTDVFTTSLWYRHYLGEPSTELEALARTRAPLYSLFVLCGAEIPWVEDGLRDGRNLRESMQDEFRRSLVESKRPWIEVSGSVQNRIESVVQEILRRKIISKLPRAAVV